MLDESRKMFTFGYDSYMKYAFPKDELDPIHCTGIICLINFQIRFMSVIE